MTGRIVLPVVLFTVLVVAVLFTALNPGAIGIDLGLYEVTMQKSLALALAFAFGWLFGLICLAVVMLRLYLERRRLRNALRLAEAEIHALRSLPAAHAD
ncbi:MAG: DUF1049 domain-containing protein [Gammaproteobacteria bacterium]|nr:DUF1049 domain-containing protein [Gammaproteobacteria bacterium]